MCCVNVVAVSELSSVRVNNGVVEWTISSSLPGECYGSYSLQLSRCMIQGFATLPTISDVAGGAVVAGKLLLMLFWCIDNNVTLYFSSYSRCYISC